MPVHARILIASATLVAIAAGGCGGSLSSSSTVATTPAAQRSVQQSGVITVRGDYAPDEHGPYDLHGRYTVHFAQRGAGVDFQQEVPFTAHLEQGAAAGPGRKIKLFQKAAASGATTVDADGRFQVLVDFGDSPYEIVLTPARR
jgi:hypothetical protein